MPVTIIVSRDSVVGIATGYGLDDRSEFKSRKSQEFSLLQLVQIDFGAHPTFYPVGTGDSFAGIKALGA
jgi:hypothetical protein